MSEPTEREYLEGLYPEAEEEYVLRRTGLYKLTRLGEGGGDEASVADIVAWLQEQGATIEEVGEPGYYDHHGNDGAFVSPGRYLVYKMDDDTGGSEHE